MTDLLKDDDGDLLLVSGDFRIGPATAQLQRDVIMLDKGWHRYNARAGAAALRWLNGNDASLRAASRVALLAEGLPATVEGTGQNLTVYV